MSTTNLFDSISAPRLNTAASFEAIIDPAEEVHLSYRTGATYDGQLKEHKKVGSGVFIWPNGAKYNGQFSNNLRNGRGIQYWPDGSYYDGEFHDDLRHGDGYIEWSNKESYKGKFFHDRRHGLGVYSWADDSTFTGTFYMDQKEGYGTFHYADGDQFQGLYEAGEREGPGILTYKNNTQDVGLWSGEKLVKICTAVKGAFLLKDHSEFDFNINQEQRTLHFDPNLLTDRYNPLKSSTTALNEVANPPTESDIAVNTIVMERIVEIFSTALDPRSLAVDKVSFESEFFRKFANKKKTTDIVAVNKTPEMIAMQKHVHRHRFFQKDALFNVKKILSGDRTSFKRKGVIELASEEMLQAAMAGNARTVEDLLISGVHPDVADSDGHTALVGATVNWHTDVIDVLLNHGANVNKLNDEGCSSFSSGSVFYYPTETFRSNIAERYLEKTSSKLNDSSRTLLNKHNSNRILDRTGVTSLSVDSGVPPMEGSKQEWTISEGSNEDIGDEKSDEELTNQRSDIQINGGESNEYVTDDEPSENKTDKETPKNMTPGTLEEEMSIWVNEDERNVETDVSLKDELSLKHELKDSDRDSVIDSDNEGEQGYDDESGEEFESDRRMRNYPIDVTDQLIEKCAVQLSSNERIVSQYSTESTGKARQMAYNISLKESMKQTLDLLLRRGADPNASDIPMPVLFFAIKAGDVEMVKMLLMKGAFTSTRLPREMGGLAPIHIASAIPGEAGVQLTELLLDALADPDARAEEDDSFMNLNLESEWRKDVPSRRSRGLLGGRTSLQIACARGDDHHYACNVVRLLLEHKANPNMICNGFSPLALAIASGNDEAIDELLANGADPNLTLTHGVGSALCAATSTEYESKRPIAARLQLIDKLVKSGADILAPIAIGPKRISGTAVDFAYYLFNQDRRIAHMPYHALTHDERETYNARRKVLGHLGDILRHKAVEKERKRFDEEPKEGHPLSCNPSQSFVYVGAGAPLPPGTKSSRHSKIGGQVTFDRALTDECIMKQEILCLEAELNAASRSRSAVPLSSNTQEARQLRRAHARSLSRSPVRKPLFKYCYQCGRSVGVRLTACTRCKEVYYDSKACKLKAWNSRHKDECIRVGGRSSSPNERAGNKLSPGPMTFGGKQGPANNKQRAVGAFHGRSKSAKSFAGGSMYNQRFRSGGVNEVHLNEMEKRRPKDPITGALIDNYSFV